MRCEIAVVSRQHEAQEVADLRAEASTRSQSDTGPRLQILTQLVAEHHGEDEDRSLWLHKVV